MVCVYKSFLLANFAINTPLKYWDTIPYKMVNTEVYVFTDQYFHAQQTIVIIFHIVVVFLC